MKQLLQNMRDGKAVVAEVPCPSPRHGSALVRTAASLVSAGTERMVVEFAEKNLLGKARSRPDLVRQVLDKARREGILPTLQAAFNRLDQPMALGYSSAGTITALGEGMEGFQVGERVACAGGGFAVHAEYGAVPRNLLAHLPDNVDFESAAFATLGAIALHGLRLAEPQLGERVAVIGLGLLGLLAVQMARAAGCAVFGVDLSPARITLARGFGVEAVQRGEAEAAGLSFSHGQGFDVVLICADARSNDPVELAGLLARDRGRVVAVGAVGLNIPRGVYYNKELNFKVSRSYGPGRYDAAYEERGQDYPAGYVRWTEGRNLQAVVDLIALGRLDVKPLISHRFAIEDAAEAYEVITGKRKLPFMGVLLTYPQSAAGAPAEPSRRIDLSAAVKALSGEACLGVLGAGNYATAVFLPAVQKSGGAKLAGIVSASGLSARHAAQKYGFGFASSLEAEVLDNPDINIVALLTRHDQHARQVLAALRAGKHVYCEKPLALTEAELDEIETELAAAPSSPKPLLTVGFNRRFAPLAVQLKAALARRSEPMAIQYRVNAGLLPLSHWTQDPAVGGGRIIGEGCHFIDFLTFLVGQPPIALQAAALPDGGRYRRDNAVLTFRFGDSSLGTLTYLANGDKTVAKERIEVFCGGTVAILDDFRSLEVTAGGQRKKTGSPFGQDKGHQAAWANFLACARAGGPPPIPYEQLISVSRMAIRAADALNGARD
jgi:predicted dehydrogenase/threonine dehydrogenase-like Zn-dependent dehydrogenase